MPSKARSKRGRKTAPARTRKRKLPARALSTSSEPSASESGTRSRATRSRSRPGSACSFISEARSQGSRWSEFGIDRSDDYLPDLTGHIKRHADHPIAGGGYADVWKGSWNTRRVTYTVAIKALRFFLSDDNENKKVKEKRLRREIRTWTRLDHPNVVPLFGVTYDFGPFAAMVCPFHSKGNLNAFLEQKSGKLEMTDRLRLMIEISEGLEYLHNNDIVHGDLTGSNVLLTEEETCCLCDFGLSTLLDELPGGDTSSVRGAVRWSAPELYRLDWDDNVSRRGTSNDIFSLGSVFLQIVSGKLPYHGDNDYSALTKLAKGILPALPPSTEVLPVHQDIMSHCWAFVPESRPTIGQVLQYLFYVRLSDSSYEQVLPCTIFWTKHKLEDSPHSVREHRSTTTSHRHPKSYISSRVHLRSHSVTREISEEDMGTLRNHGRSSKRKPVHPDQRAEVKVDPSGLSYLEMVPVDVSQSRQADQIIGSSREENDISRNYGRLIDSERVQPDRAAKVKTRRRLLDTFSPSKTSGISRDMRSSAISAWYPRTDKDRASDKDEERLKTCGRLHQHRRLQPDRAAKTMARRPF